MRVRNFSKVVAVATTVVWMSGCSSTSTSTDSVDTAPVVQEPVVEVAKPIPVAKEPTVKTVVMSDEEIEQLAFCVHQHTAVAFPWSKVHCL